MENPREVHIGKKIPLLVSLWAQILQMDISPLCGGHLCWVGVSPFTYNDHTPALASAASSSVTSSPVSTPCSTCSMKTKHDYVANLHEQGHAEQVQTDCEVTQLHEVCMAHIEASTQREKMRHERRVLKYQLWIEEVKAKTSQQNIFEP